MKRMLDLETLELTAGAHDDPESGMCVMEAAAYIAGEPFSDHPACVSLVLAAFCRMWNDTAEPYGQAIRDRLRGYIPRLIGTASDAAVEERRAWLATDWLIRVQMATWLKRAGLTEHAQTMLDLPPQTSREALVSSAAARAAAGDAAWDAARAAARAAAGDAAGDAAGAAAGDAAWDAARAAAGDAAGDAAWAAAWAAAGDAAGAAVGDAARAAAWAAVVDAVVDALKPTVEELQASAWELLDAMIACGTVSTAE